MHNLALFWNLATGWIGRELCHVLLCAPRGLQRLQEPHPTNLQRLPGTKSALASHSRPEVAHDVASAAVIKENTGSVMNAGVGPISIAAPRCDEAAIVGWSFLTATFFYYSTSLCSICPKLTPSLTDFILTSFSTGVQSTARTALASSLPIYPSTPHPTMSAPNTIPPPGEPAPELLDGRIWVDGCFDFFHHGMMTD